MDSTEKLDASYWSGLCPELTVDEGGASCRPFPFSQAPAELPDVDVLRDRMIRDGYFNISELPWAVDVEAIGRSAKILVDAGLPASFLLAYREPWLVAHQVKFAFICAYELLWTTVVMKTKEQALLVPAVIWIPLFQVKELLWMATGNEQIFDW